MKIIRKYEPDLDMQVRALLALLGCTKTHLEISSQSLLQNWGQQANLGGDDRTTRIGSGEDEGGTNEQCSP